MFKHKFTFNSLLATSLLCILCISCQNEDLDQNDVNQEQTLTKEAKATLSYLTDHGYSREDLSPNSESRTFDVGDISIPFSLKANLDKNRVTEEEEEGVQSKNQWYYVGSGVYYSNSRNIEYYIERNFPRRFEYEVSWAAYHWSRVSPNINFRRTYTRSRADILIGSWYSTSDRAWARAALPSGNGNVGSWMSMNTAKDFDGNGSAANMALFIHEFGHNLGYLHSDQYEGGLIPGTRGAAYHQRNNCGSVMKSSVYTCNWRISATPGWTYDDRIAIDWAYDIY